MEDEKLELFLNEKPVKALIKIRQSPGTITASDLSTKIDTTYAHTIKILKKMEKDLDEPLLERSQKGRRKPIKLTEEGKKNADSFQELVDQLREKEEEQQMYQKVEEKQSEKISKESSGLLSGRL